MEPAWLVKIIVEKLGLLKAWCSVHHIPWYQVAPSHAKKVIFNHGKIEKKQVLDWARSSYPQIPSQHCADALLYLESWRKEF